MYELIHGDCIEEMPKLKSGSIDLILTDPPYGTMACKWDSVIPFDSMWEQTKRVRKDRAVVALFGSEPFSSFLRCSNIKEFKYDWIWDKFTCGNPFLAKYQPMKEHEIVSIFYKKSGRYYPIKQKRSEKSLKRKTCWAGVKTGNWAIQGRGIAYEDRSNRDQVFRFPRSIQVFHLDTIGGSKGKRFHPTQKPVALLEYLIKTYTKPGETVLDFTMGSGSTCIACINTGRNFIGIEKDEEIFSTAKKRIEDFVIDKELELKLG
jgi:DNA modification methylase